MPNSIQKTVNPTGRFWWRPIALIVACVLAVSALAADSNCAISADQRRDGAAAKAEKKKPSPKKTKPAKPSAAGEKDKDLHDDDDEVPEIPPAIEYETVKLADGTEIKVEKWGDTFQGYEFRPPLNADDWREPAKRAKADKGVETVIDYGDPKSPFAAGGFLDHRMGDVRIDVKNQKIYWVDSVDSHYGGHLNRASLTGKNVETLQSKLHEPHGLALDLTNGKVYWSEVDSHDRPSTGVRRTSLKGGNVEKVVVGLQSPGGIAVDGAAGKLYYTANAGGGPPRILSCNLDGSGESIFLERTSGWSMTISDREGALYWAQAGGDQIHSAALREPRNLVEFGVGSTANATSDTRFGRIWAMDYDERHRKVFWVDRSYGHVCRANPDCTQVEILVVGTCEPKGIAIDFDRGYLYWSETRSQNAVLVGRIRRIKIPPIPRPKAMSVPSTITRLEPPHQSTGGTIVAHGAGFTNATSVTFCDTTTGDHVKAKYAINSDSELVITVPKLDATCKSAVIAIATPAGVGIALPKSLTVRQPASGGYIQFDRLKAEPRECAMWLTPSTRVAGVERMVAVANAAANAHTSPRGRSVLFLKNGALATLRSSPNCVIYHEPYAVIAQRDLAADGITLIPVPAIRASFVEQEFQYEVK